MNAADLSWPEDAGFRLSPPGSGDPLQDALIVAQANLALAGARRERYGRLPGRSEDICEQLNAEIVAAQAECDDARAALLSQPKADVLPATQPAYGPPLVE